MTRYFELINTYHSDRVDIPIALVATKIDLLKGDFTLLEEPARIAQSKGWLFHKTSAKDNIGVNELFESLICKHFNLVTSPQRTDEKSPLVTIRPIERNFGQGHQTYFGGGSPEKSPQQMMPIANEELVRLEVVTRPAPAEASTGGLLSKLAKLCCG